MFFTDKTTRAICSTDNLARCLEWDCQGRPVFYFDLTLGRHLFMVSNDAIKYYEDQKRSNYPLGQYISYVVHASGFCYSFGGKDKPVVELNDEKSATITAVLEVLPMPISDAIAKQFPLLTLEKWHRDFAKKYPREQYTDAVLASGKFIL